MVAQRCDVAVAVVLVLPLATVSEKTVVTLQSDADSVLQDVGSSGYVTSPARPTLDGG